MRDDRLFASGSSNALSIFTLQARFITIFYSDRADILKSRIKTGRKITESLEKREEI